MYTRKKIDQNESSIDEENVNDDDLETKIIELLESFTKRTLKFLVTQKKLQVNKSYYKIEYQSSSTLKGNQTWVDVNNVRN